MSPASSICPTKTCHEYSKCTLQSHPTFAQFIGHLVSLAKNPTADKITGLETSTLQALQSDQTDGNVARYTIAMHIRDTTREIVARGDVPSGEVMGACFEQLSSRFSRFRIDHSGILYDLGHSQWIGENPTKLWGEEENKSLIAVTQKPYEASRNRQQLVSEASDTYERPQLPEPFTVTDSGASVPTPRKLSSRSWWRKIGCCGLGGGSEEHEREDE